jgi:transcriptional regulator with XRE-family HTH domain
VTNPRLHNYLRTHRRRFGLSQADVAILLGATSGTKVSRYENFKRMPDAVTVFALEIIYNRPAGELFAGSYDTIRASVRDRARRMMKELKKQPEKQDKNIVRKLELLSAIVEANMNVVRRS